MLVLSRKLHEKVLLPGIATAIEVVGIKGNIVRLGFQAPPGVAILREELQGTLTPGGERRQGLTDRFQTLTTALLALREQAGSGAGHLLETITLIEQELDSLRQSVGAPEPRRPGKALLVEDDRNERELLATFLRMGGLAVDTVGDGVEALDYLHTHTAPDVVLLDMGLPRCDGPTVIRTLRRDPVYAGLKVFAVTGETPASHAGLAVDRWFEKPLNVEVLLRDINRAVVAAV